jgi:hypothetical protein
MMTMKTFVVSCVTVLGLVSAQMAFASEKVCQAQKAAAPDLIKARDASTPMSQVVESIKARQSSEASGKVLTESLAALYADPKMAEGSAADMIYQRCIAALGK